MDVREKLVELMLNADNDENLGSYDLYDVTHERTGCAEYFADYLIANGVTVQDWISVKDRLPKSMDWVLCICADGKFHILRYDYISGDWDIYNKNNCCYGEWFVTHWMPLPQPPKGE